MLSEAHSLLRHAIEPRRADKFLAVTAEVAVAEIVSEEIDDIGFGCLGKRAGGQRQHAPGDDGKTKGLHGLNGYDGADVTRGAIFFAAPKPSVALSHEPQPKVDPVYGPLVPAVPLIPTSHEILTIH